MLEPKNCQIVLKSVLSHNSFNLNIFDVPGTLSTKLKAQKNIFQTSTFQCVIVIYQANLSEWWDRSLQFLTQHVTLIHIQRDRFSVDLQLPQVTCSTQLCAFEFLSDNGTHLNVTVMSLLFSWPVDFFCKFGGIVVLERSKKSADETYTLCISYSGAHSQSRSFYSKSSNLSLVMYWYLEYTKIQATLRVSETKCTPIQIDPCFVVQNCFSLPYSETLNMTSCESYLSNLKQESGILFSPTKHEFASGIEYDLQNKGCVVFQLSQSKNCQMGSHVENCVMFLVNSEIRTVQPVQYEMRGSVHESVLMLDCVTVETAPGYVCTKTHISEEKVCTPEGKVTHKHFAPAKNNTTNIFSSHMFEQHVASKSVVLNPVAFFGQTHSWIDMTIQTDMKVEKTEILPFSVQHSLHGCNRHIHWELYRLVGSYTYSFNLQSHKPAYLNFEFTNSLSCLISSESLYKFILQSNMNFSGNAGASLSNYK